MTGMTQTGGSYLVATLCAAAIVIAVPFLIVCACTLDRVLLARTRSRFRTEPVAVGEALAEVIARLRRLASTELLSRETNRSWSWVGPFVSLFFATMALAVVVLWVLLGEMGLNAGIVLVLAAIACSGFAMLASASAEPPRMSPAPILRGLLPFAGFGAAAILGLVSALLFSGSLSMPEIAKAQWDQGTWFIVVVPIGFAIYLFGSVSAMQGAALAAPESAEVYSTANRAHDGFSRLLLLAAEATNMFAISGVAAVVFLGGAQRPLARYHDHLLGTSIELLDALPPILLLLMAVALLRGAVRRRALVSDESIHEAASLVPSGLVFTVATIMGGSLLFGHEGLAAVNGAFWFAAKVLACVAAFLWFRIAVAAICFEQWMKAAWPFLIPLAIANLVGAAVSIVLRQSLGWTPLWSVLLTTAATIAFGLWLISCEEATQLDRLPGGEVDAAE